MSGIPEQGKSIRVNDTHGTLAGRTGTLLYHQPDNADYWKCNISGNYFGTSACYPSGEVWLYTNQFTIVEPVKPKLLHFTL